MRLEDRQSDNIEDRRGEAYGGVGPSLGGMLGGGGQLGFGAIIVLSLIGYALGIDPRILIAGASLIAGAGGGSQYTLQVAAPPQPGRAPASDQMTRFVSSILAETEDVWGKVLPEQKNIRYIQPKLVLFNGSTSSGCGGAEASMGPFYCPEDQKVYLDTSFFADMKSKYGGGGDFAYAYVIAHEIGHHVENLLGILPKVQQAQERATSKQQANALSVRVELMADCLAGVWAANANQQWQILEPGDTEKAMATAQAIGDDRLQTAARGYAVPDSFTHGSSAQRQQWLTTGLKSGQVDSCNTFAQ